MEEKTLNKAETKGEMFNYMQDVLTQFSNDYVLKIFSFTKQGNLEEAFNLVNNLVLEDSIPFSRDGICIVYPKSFGNILSLDSDLILIWEKNKENDRTRMWILFVKHAADKIIKILKGKIEEEYNTWSKDNSATNGVENKHKFYFKMFGCLGLKIPDNEYIHTPVIED